MMVVLHRPLQNHGESIHVMVHSSCHGEADSWAHCSLILWLCDEVSQWNHRSLS